MKQYTSHKNGLSFLTLWPFDVYHSIDDRVKLKKYFNKLFDVGDEIFCYFRREEDLTEEEELIELKKRVFERFNIPGNEFKYLFKIDERRFDAIAKLRLDVDLANVIIEMWKCFYSFSFFIPINCLTFDEYEEYLDINGFDDEYGMNHIYERLANFICIKGGIDNMVITFNDKIDLAYL